MVNSKLGSEIRKKDGRKILISLYLEATRVATNFPAIITFVTEGRMIPPSFSLDCSRTISPSRIVLYDPA